MICAALFSTRFIQKRAKLRRCQVHFTKIHFGNQSLKAVAHRFQKKNYVLWASKDTHTVVIWNCYIATNLLTFQPTHRGRFQILMHPTRNIRNTQKQASLKSEKGKQILSYVAKATAVRIWHNHPNWTFWKFLRAGKSSAQWEARDKGEKVSPFWDSKLSGIRPRELKCLEMGKSGRHFRAI